jgi:hypothetical protein
VFFSVEEVLAFEGLRKLIKNTNFLPWISQNWRLRFLWFWWSTFLWRRLGLLFIIWRL